MDALLEKPIRERTASDMLRLSASPGFRSYLGSILTHSKGDLNAAVECLEKWARDYPKEFHSLTRGEIRHIKNVFKICASEGNLGKLTLHSNTVLANVCTQLDSSLYAKVFMQRLVELGQPPSADAVALLFFPKHYKTLLDWVKRENLQINAPLAIKHLGEQGGWDYALKLAIEVERGYTKSNTECFSAGVIIPYMLSGGRWDDAISLFHEVVSQGNLVGNSMIQSMVEASIISSTSGDHWRSSLAFVSAVHRATMMAPIRDASVYHNLMNCAPGWEAALLVLHTANANRVAVDETLATATLAHCEEGGQWRVAAELASRMSRDGSLQNNLTAEGYKALIQSYQEGQQWKRAIEAVKWMSSVGFASHEAGLISMVQVCSKAGEWDVALEVGSTLLQEVQEEAQASLPRSTYVALLEACVSGRQWESAISLHHSLMQTPTASTPPKAATLVMEACLASGQWEQATKVHAGAKKYEPRVVVPRESYALAIKACISGHQWRAATYVLNDMRRKGIRHQGAIGRELHTQRVRDEKKQQQQQPLPEQPQVLSPAIERLLDAATTRRVPERERGAKRHLGPQ